MALQANGFAGTVVSGTGSTYTVQIITDTGTENVTVTQMQIDAGETIPAGTKVLVVKTAGVYRMQVPVWLDDG